MMKKIILLVEDEAIIAMATMAEITKWDYDVVVANSGEKAVQIATDPSKHIDLILMDIDLGRGMSGPEAASNILATITLPIVFLTSHSEREMVEKVRGITRYGYVIKNSGGFVLHSSIEMAFELFGSKMEIVSRSKTLHEHSQLLENIMDNFPGIIYWKDRNSIYLGCNMAFVKASGYQDKDDIISKSDYDLPWDHEEAFDYRKDDTAVMESKQPRLHYEEPQHFPDGRSLILDTCKMPLFDKDGEVIGLLGVSSDITEKKKAERELLKLGMAVDQSPTIVVITNSSGDIEYVNTMFSAVTGYSASEAIGQNPRILKSGSTSAESYKELWETIRSGRNWHGTFKNKKKNGDYYYESALIAPVKNSLGQIINYIALKEDISSRILVEQSLKKSEEKYRLISENTSDGIIHFSAASFIDYVSPTYVRQLGYDEGEELGRNQEAISRLMHPDDRDAVFLNIMKAIEAKESELTYTYRVLHKSGHFIWREDHARFMFDDSGNYCGAYVICRDISERKRAEATLRSSEMKYTAIIENIGEGIALVDPEEKFTFANKAAESIFGVGNGQLIGLNLEQFLSAEQLDVVKRETAFRIKGMTSSYEIGILRPDGEARNILVTAVPLNDKDEGFVGTYGVFRDITDRKRMEDELRRSEERFRSMFDKHSAIMLLIEADSGAIEDANDSAAAFYGYDKQVLRSMNICQLNIQPKERILEEMREATSGKRNIFMFTHRLANGDMRKVEVNSSPFIVSGVTFLYSIIHEVTEP